MFKKTALFSRDGIPYLSQSCHDDTFEYFSNSYLVSLWCQYFCFLETYSSLPGWIQNGKAVTTSHKLHKITKFSDTFPEKHSNNVGEEKESKVGENIMHRSSPKWRLNCFPSRYIKCGAILGNVPICVKGCWWKGRLCDGVRFVKVGLVGWVLGDPPRPNHAIAIAVKHDEQKNFTAINWKEPNNLTSIATGFEIWFDTEWRR